MYTYGKELPWFRTERSPWPGYCRGKVGCKIGYASQLVDSPWDYGSKNDLYNAGITSGWHGGTGKIFRRLERWESPGDGECGYWASIPAVKHTCGTTTTAIVNQDISQNIKGADDKCLHDKVWESYSTHDCVDQWASIPASDPRDTTRFYIFEVDVFVKINCWDQKPLPANMQHDAYNGALQLSDKERENAYQKFRGLRCKGIDRKGYYNTHLFLEGRGFPESLLGSDGSALKSSLNDYGCGVDARFKYTFVWEPQGPPDYYEWKANIPFGPTWILPSEYQCVLDWFHEHGGPMMYYYRDCIDEP
ncbi:hypothetical protein PG996_014759 [Apiospora saccharicola]|uniref:C-type lectin domain-containing protein n=1 Tax=Apiospora saccharicola TaxID=335842 RepID=A0ABR1TJ83_9PEZI